MSVTLLHSAKAVEQNEMPFGRDTRIGYLGGETPSHYDQSAAAISKSSLDVSTILCRDDAEYQKILLWPLFRPTRLHGVSIACYAEPCVIHRPNVCLSVCLSHAQALC